MHTQRRTILERFREQYGDYPVGSMPPKFIAAVLTKKKPHAARNWLQTLRALCQFAVEQQYMREDPTRGLKLPSVKSPGHHRPTPRSHSTRRITQLARRRGSRLGSCSTPHSGAASSSKWACSTCATARSCCANRRPTSRWSSRLARAAGDPRRHAEPAPDVSAHQERPAVPAAQFQSPVPQMVRRGRFAEALHGAWPAQGRLPSDGRSRLLGQRDRGLERPRNADRDQALHRCRRPGADGAQRDGTGEHRGNSKCQTPVKFDTLPL